MSSRHFEAVSLLLKHGADANARIAKSFYYRVSGVDIKVTIEAHIICKQTGWAALHLADNSEIVSLLLQNGANVNARIDNAGHVSSYCIFIT